MMVVPGFVALHHTQYPTHTDPSYVDTEIGVGEGSKADALHKALWTANELLRGMCMCSRRCYDVHVC